MGYGQAHGYSFSLSMTYLVAIGTDSTDRWKSNDHM